MFPLSLHVLSPEAVAISGKPHAVDAVLKDVEDGHTDVLYGCEGACGGIVVGDSAEGADPYCAFAVFVDGVGAAVECVAVCIAEDGDIVDLHGLQVYDVHALRVGAHVEYLTVTTEGVGVVAAAVWTEGDAVEEVCLRVIVAEASVVAGYPKSALAVFAELVDDVAGDGVGIVAVDAGDEVGGYGVGIVDSSVVGAYPCAAFPVFEYRVHEVVAEAGCHIALAVVHFDFAVLYGEDGETAVAADEEHAWLDLKYAVGIGHACLFGSELHTRFVEGRVEADDSSVPQGCPHGTFFCLGECQGADSAGSLF